MDGKLEYIKYPVLFEEYVAGPLCPLYKFCPLGNVADVFSSVGAMDGG